MPELRAGDFAQAMMDLGATICTPKSPNCLICPWTEDCAGRQRGIRRSCRASGRRPPCRCGAALPSGSQRGDGAVLLRRRPEKGLLGGMMEVPSTDWAATLPQDPAAQAPLDATWVRVPGLVQHTFTHFQLELTVLKAVALSDGVLRDDGDYRWVARTDLAGEALPTVMRKVVALVEGCEWRVANGEWSCNGLDS